MPETCEMCEEMTGPQMVRSCAEANRIGDHISWISDSSRFQHDYPAWRPQYNVPAIFRDILDRNSERWAAEMAV